MKNYGDLGKCYPPWPTATTDNTLLDLHKFFKRYSASFIVTINIFTLDAAEVENNSKMFASRMGAI